MKYVYDYKRDKTDLRDIRFSATIFPHSEVVLPKSVDLRPKCPPVYDQGSLGSCTANAGCACRIMLLQDPQTDLSRLFLYFMERDLEDNIKKDVGASLRDTCKSIYKFGICEEKYMPYDEEKFAHPPSKKAFINADSYRITAYKSLGTLDEIKQNLALRQQPVLLGMDVYESFENKEVAETGLMRMPKKDEKKLGGHAVLVTGYKDIKRPSGYKAENKLHMGYLIVRNSWGSNWGDKGYFYMPYDYARPEYTYDYWIME